MSLYMAEVEGKYIFIADGEVSVLSVDSMALEAEPTLIAYLDAPEGFEEISPLR